MKHFLIFIMLLSTLLGTTAFAVPPECKENPKLCEINATLAELKAEVVSIEKNCGDGGTGTASSKACSAKGQPCSFSSDCCGDKLFCLGGSAGQPRYCREVGEKLTISATTMTKSLSSSCEQRCYNARRDCIDRNGNSHSCDVAYDSCKKSCN